ncbi:basic salivary proline-rich protein 2-like [Macrobrachium nipponense]|uniref:basic salivary proline-rich protein 2-like n=1 Tax=Macrobrachium nipponense TaxID=159736 RepID=UPI0030C8757A
MLGGQNQALCHPPVPKRRPMLVGPNQALQKFWSEKEAKCWWAQTKENPQKIWSVRKEGPMLVGQPSLANPGLKRKPIAGGPNQKLRKTPALEKKPKNGWWAQNQAQQQNPAWKRSPAPNAGAQTKVQRKSGLVKREKGQCCPNQAKQNPWSEEEEEAQLQRCKTQAQPKSWVQREGIGKGGPTKLCKIPGPKEKEKALKFLGWAKPRSAKSCPRKRKAKLVGPNQAQGKILAGREGPMWKAHNSAGGKAKPKASKSPKSGLKKGKESPLLVGQNQAQGKTIPGWGKRERAQPKLGWAKNQALSPKKSWVRREGPKLVGQNQAQRPKFRSKEKKKAQCKGGPKPRPPWPNNPGPEGKEGPPNAGGPKPKLSQNPGRRKGRPKIAGGPKNQAQKAKNLARKKRTQGPSWRRPKCLENGQTQSNQPNPGQKKRKAQGLGGPNQTPKNPGTPERKEGPKIAGGPKTKLATQSGNLEKKAQLWWGQNQAQKNPWP